jgi:hypothetical protein
MKHRITSIALIGLAALTACPARGDLSLETETARLVKPGHFEFSAAGEYQHSPQGEEYDIPLAIEWGVMPRLALLIEPVAYTVIRGLGGPAAKGIGDLELTLQYLVLDERQYFPAIAAAVEGRIPTARNRLIGSGVADYRVYVIASKQVGDFDFHFNAGYNVIGAPSGTKTKNPVDLEFAIEWFVHPKFDLFAEVNYVDSSRGASTGAAASAGGGGEGGALLHADSAQSFALRGPHAGGAITAEVAGTEIVGTAGIRYHLNPQVDVYTSLSYDNNYATLVRTGITWKL